MPHQLKTKIPSTLQSACSARLLNDSRAKVEGGRERKGKGESARIFSICIFFHFSRICASCDVFGKVSGTAAAAWL